MLTDNEVQDGSMYSYKDELYTVLQCDNLVMKSPHDGNWYPAVAYHSNTFDDNKPIVICVRQLEDFQAKFKAIIPDCGE